MAREPVAGRVKTRLARALGTAAATRFYRTAAATTVARLAAAPWWDTILAVTPDAAAASRMLPGRVGRIAQGRGDLGARMQAPMRHLPPGPVCVIGTDIPEIEPEHVRRAFRLLGARDLVLGPALDGGFWLVGMRRRPRVRSPYAGVEWSRDTTLAQVVANAERLELVTGFTAVLGDVDTPADLARVAGVTGRRVRAPNLRRR